MSFGHRLLEAGKKKNLSQEDLALMLKTKGPAIGRYERDEMRPSIEIVAKMADILDMSLDYLVGKSESEVDKKTLNRFMELQQLPDDMKDEFFYFIDMSIRDYKANKAYTV